MKNVAKTELMFHETTLVATKRAGQVWFTAADLAKALQYANVKSVTNLYNQNFDEFSAGMSEVIESVTSGNYRKRVRLFSLRGAHLLAMFARTPVAKEFRRWVLDILDKESKPRISEPQSFPTLLCPCCNSPAAITYIERNHRLKTTLHIKCTNRQCGVPYLTTIEHQYQLVEDEFESVRRAINSLSDEQKSLALGLLLRS